MRIPDLIKACRKKGLQRLVVTDHNSIEGALQAQALEPRTFIIGEEILTQQGELLAIFVKEAIPAGLPALEVIQLLRSQGAFISVSHPFDSLRKGHWQLSNLLAIAGLIDAIEVFNSRCLSPLANTLAKNFALQNHLLATVGSDAHSSGEVGASTLTLPDFDDPNSLQKALSYAQANVRLSSPWVHFYSRYATWYKKPRANLPDLS